MELGILQNQLFSNTAEGIAKQTHNFDFVFAFLKAYKSWYRMDLETD